jgi:hypothetical protein
MTTTMAGVIATVAMATIIGMTVTMTTTVNTAVTATTAEASLQP